MTDHLRCPPEGLTRRRFLQTGLILGGLGLFNAGSLRAGNSPAINLPFPRGRRPMKSFPRKRPLMVVTTRPPQLETPFPIFNGHIFTPNDAFFVRWHIANIPTSIDLQSFQLTVRGRVKHSISLSLDALQKDFEPVKVAAVCQCAGNSRGFFDPRVAGTQWGHGAMGNAVWMGVRLRDILEKAGLKDDARYIRFDGLDRPVADGTPDFRKSLSLDDAVGEQVLVAYAMNGEPLPYLNGFPLRLVVPGWYATYWVKMLCDLEVLNEEDRNFWMASAYRIPDNACGCLSPGETPRNTVPISTMPVRSFITNISDGATVSSGRNILLKGIAFDQGSGIDQVLVSLDGGGHWQAATLGKDEGRFSFRSWSIHVSLRPEQHYQLQARARNRQGDSQPLQAIWNSHGYLSHAVETVHITTKG